MGFLSDDPELDGQPPAKEDKYVKFPEVDQGKKVELRMRILDARPKKIFQHWIGPNKDKLRPFNCPSRSAGCPACHERQVLRDRGEDPRELHRISKRYLVNALVYYPGESTPKQQIFAFGQKLGNDLDLLHDRNGDLREYDIVVIKRKTGPFPMNVEYSAIYDDNSDPAKRRKLSAEEKSLAEQKYDLEVEGADATVDAIAAAIRGEQPEQKYASAAQVELLRNYAAKQGMTLADFDIADPSKADAKQVAELLNIYGSKSVTAV